MAAYLDAAIASALKKARKDEIFRLKAEKRAMIEAIDILLFQPLINQGRLSGSVPQSSSHWAKGKSFWVENELYTNLAVVKFKPEKIQASLTKLSNQLPVGLTAQFCTFIAEVMSSNPTPA